LPAPLQTVLVSSGWEAYKGRHILELVLGGVSTGAILRGESAGFRRRGLVVFRFMTRALTSGGPNEQFTNRLLPRADPRSLTRSDARPSLSIGYAL
jgi:hypothetical protein